jgi:hypothetical protein
MKRTARVPGPFVSNRHGFTRRRSLRTDTVRRPIPRKENAMNRCERAALAGLVLALSACAQAPVAGGDAGAAPAGVCDAKPLAWTIGKAADADLLARAQAESGARTVRVLHPGQMITMEFSETRLNLRVDTAGKVLSYSCG